jgi:hypothetical protein
LNRITIYVVQDVALQVKYYDGYCAIN